MERDCVNFVCLWKHARPLREGGTRAILSHCAGSILLGTFPTGKRVTLPAESALDIVYKGNEMSTPLPETTAQVHAPIMTSQSVYLKKRWPS